ncbi:hypothetical protein BDQ12DRAFT_671492 [Crucibulum laeve]|uniref:Uncharacterized protein n=1 Tax=Crucibulum laeve TaxID=68775 RepID=A0A5C3LGC9_9AGAR|nr:hypothetical protein BDQ12DRAFT_671492 [Crucibulum laeve]
MSNTGHGKSYSFFYGAQNSHFDQVIASNNDSGNLTFQGTPEEIAAVLRQGLGNIQCEDKERKLLNQFENISNCTFAGGNFQNIARVPFEAQRYAGSSGKFASFEIVQKCELTSGFQNLSSLGFILYNEWQGTRTQYFAGYRSDKDISQIEEAVD